MAVKMLDKDHLAHCLKEARRALKARKITWEIQYLPSSHDTVLHVSADTGESFNILL